MADILVSVPVQPMDVSRAGRRAGFYGTDSRASVIRYALARFTGMDHEQARSAALRIPLGTDKGMKVSGTNIKAKVDAELLERAESMMPAGIPNRSTLVRYALALVAEFPPDEALDEASRRMGRPRKQSENAA